MLSLFLPLRRGYPDQARSSCRYYKPLQEAAKAKEKRCTSYSDYQPLVLQFQFCILFSDNLGVTSHQSRHEELKVSNYPIKIKVIHPVDGIPPPYEDRITLLVQENPEKCKHMREIGNNKKARSYTLETHQHLPSPLFFLPSPALINRTGLFFQFLFLKIWASVQSFLRRYNQKRMEKNNFPKLIKRNPVIDSVSFLSEHEIFFFPRDFFIFRMRVNISKR